MQTSETLDKLFTALSKAQGAIEGASKGSENPHFKSRYADIASVWSACRKPLADNGLSVFQGITHGDNGHVHLKTRLCHASGQWMEDDGVPLLLDKPNMHGQMSAMTYAKRAGLMNSLGIAPEDDDGNAAVQNDKPVGKPIKVAAKRGKAEPSPSETAFETIQHALKQSENAEELAGVWKSAQISLSGLPDDLTAKCERVKDDMKVKFAKAAA